MKMNRNSVKTMIFRAFGLQEIKDWILEYAVSIQDRLRWWEVSSEAFKGLLKTSITNKHYNDEHPDRGGQTSSSAAESTKGKVSKFSNNQKNDDFSILKLSVRKEVRNHQGQRKAEEASPRTKPRG